MSQPKNLEEAYKNAEESLPSILNNFKIVAVGEGLKTKYLEKLILSLKEVV